MLTSEWKKSNRSNSGGCVEVALIDGMIHIRDTKQEGRPDRSILRFTPTEWKAFTGGAKDGEFDLAE